MSQADFVNRKIDHLRLSLMDEIDAKECSQLEQVQLIHESMPELDLNQISIETSFLDSLLKTPFYIAGMTAGHEQAETLNSTLAALSANRGWLMGVGSQRREVDSMVEASFSDASVASLVTRFPTLKLMANLGMSQLIGLHQSKQFSKFFSVLERMRASGVAIHLNPLQEAIQGEGTPLFLGGLDALKNLVAQSPVPVSVKETGCGMSESTLKKLSQCHLFAIDVSGLGGTHWGRIEGRRAEEKSISASLGQTFKNWGITTVDSVLNAKKVSLGKTEIWASGGVRSGLDAAKLIALGATRVGFARPALQAALQGETVLNHWMQTIEQELKVALFCTDSATVKDLNLAKVKNGN